MFDLDNDMLTSVLTPLRLMCSRVFFTMKKESAITRALFFCKNVKKKCRFHRALVSRAPLAACCGFTETPIALWDFYFGLAP